ncbi:SAM-dependent methyltransferase [Thermopolyspora sp. NPDC052614]|uniref:SAM-dependent methyltransferase n=1 Tax=Thermopolyspora sp. NPDC052614 TaxID=3155682 RepID=UPI003414FF86
MRALFNPRVATSARVYDWLLGGKDDFAADREVGARLLEVRPEARWLMAADGSEAASQVSVGGSCARAVTVGDAGPRRIAVGMTTVRSQRGWV